ncbi:MAG: RnfABCDGE type electron transport complex subunit D [Oscillospiraceae bacterium]|nr:RnfABCDGE type electron transport complex subunit D [Oscillospiraceae bacterium]
MQAKELKAPHIRLKDSARSTMLDVLIALLPLYFMATYFYGARALALGGVSLLSAVAADVICVFLSGRRPNPRDFSALVTGLLIPLMLPASVPYYVPVTAAVFAIAVVKHPFGGVGQNIFNPAAGGFAFVSVCWPSLVFSYPQPMFSLPITGELPARLAESPAHALMLGAVPTIDKLDLMLGKFAGPMGVTNILVLATCFLYLLFRRAINWQAPAAFLGMTAAIAYLFPRIPVSRSESVAFELLSGTLVFAGIFLLSDPVTSPKRGLSRFVYGALAGAATMLLRYYGGFEQTAAFALLLVNSFTLLLDHELERLFRIVRRAVLGFRAYRRNQRIIKKV